MGRNSLPRYALWPLAQFEPIRHLTDLVFYQHSVMAPSSPAKNCQGSRFSRQLPDHAAGYTELNGTSSRSRAVLTLQQPLAVANLVVVVVI